jgi:hypothetical protein
VPNRTEQRMPTAPDALDLALNLGGVFDGDLGRVSDDDWQGEDADWQSDVEVTARANEHVPSPKTADDEEAPAPEDLGRTWLSQATESERRLGFADTLPDFSKSPTSSDEASADSDEFEDEDEDDETTAQYVRPEHFEALRGSSVKA